MLVLLVLGALAPGTWNLVVAQCPDGTPPPCARATRSGAVVSPTSVAVLYLDNLSRDTADTYLAEGLTEELTSRLGDVERLRVSGRAAVRRAQLAAAGDFAALGRALTARYLVEGSVRRSGDAVRIAVRLLRASDGVRVWGASYDRRVTDILMLQEEIAREVVTNIVGQLLPAERTRLAARPTTNATAYVHYLRGTWLLGRRSAPGAFTGAIAAFDEALRLDSTFTAAAAKRAHGLLMAYAYGADFAPLDSLRAWGVAATHAALRRDSTLADAWLALAVAASFVNMDGELAVAASSRAVMLDPRSADAHHGLGVNLMWTGRETDAAAAFRRALTIDPGRAVTMLDLAELALVGGRLDEAAVLIDSALAADQQQARIRLMRARINLRRGDPAAARADVAAVTGMLTPGLGDDAEAVRVQVAVASGDSAAARRGLAALRSLPSRAAHARAWLAMGVADSALAVLERAPPNSLAVWELRFPEFDEVRTEPRFQRIIATWRRAPAPR